MPHRFHASMRVPSRPVLFFSPVDIPVGSVGEAIGPWVGRVTGSILLLLLLLRLLLLLVLSFTTSYYYYRLIVVIMIFGARPPSVQAHLCISSRLRLA